jgi:hypothetical protein
MDNGVVKSMVPFERASDALKYEQAVKSRPGLFTIYAKVDEKNKYQLCIYFNAKALGHRAMAAIPLLANIPFTVEWRLNTQQPASAKAKLGKFFIGTNEGNQGTSHVFPGFTSKGSGVNLELRVDQRRSLTWMLRQESEEAALFVEEEYEEACLPYLGWRAEARASRFVQVLGGVLVDRVGYGKTIIILALIALGQKKATTTAHTSPTGLIAVKATLIVLPLTLIKQWKDEICRFLAAVCGICCTSRCPSFERPPRLSSVASEGGTKPHRPHGRVKGRRISTRICSSLARRA